MPASRDNRSATAPSEGRADTRDQDVRIRAAAVDLFFEHGFDGVGIRQIASSVSLNSGTLYHYYPSKRAILHRVMLDTNEALYNETVDALGAVSDPRLRLIRLAGVLVSIQAASRRTCYIVDNELRAVDDEPGPGAQIYSSRRRYEDLWRQTLSDGSADKQFQCQNQDITRLSMLGMYSATSLWYRRNAAVDAVTLCIQMVNLGLALVNTTPAQPDETAELIDILDFRPFIWEPPDTESFRAGLPSYADAMH